MVPLRASANCSLGFRLRHCFAGRHTIPRELPLSPSSSSSRRASAVPPHVIDLKPRLEEEVRYAESHEALYIVLRSTSELLSGKSASDALASLARLDTRAAGPPSGNENAPSAAPTRTSLSLYAEQALARRLSRVLAENEELSPLAEANLLWSLAKISAREPFRSLVSAVCTRVLDKVHKMKSRDLATCLWAVAVLSAETKGLAHGPLPAALCKHLSENARLRGLVPYDLSQALWAASKLSLEGAHMLDFALELVQSGFGQAPDFDAHSVSLSLWALGLMEDLHQNPDVQRFAGELAAASLTLISKMSSQSLANGVSGAARLSVRHEAYYDAVAERATKLMRSPDASWCSQRLFNILWAFCKLEVVTPAIQRFALLVASEGRSGGKLEAMDTQYLSGVASRLAKFFTADQQHLARNVTVPEEVRLAIGNIASSALKGISTWAPMELSQVTWAGARVRLADEVIALLPPVIERLGKSAVSERNQDLHEGPASNEVHLKDCVMVLWSLAVVEISRDSIPPEGLRGFVSLTLRALTSFKAGASGNFEEASFWSSCAWACARADLPSPADALIQSAFGSACRAGPGSGWNMRCLMLLAWAMVIQQRGMTEQHARFVRTVYEAGVKDLAVTTDPSDEVAAQIEQLDTLRVALVCHPVFRTAGLSLLPLPDELQRIRKLDVTQSHLQKQIDVTLRHLGFAKQIRSEMIADGSMSIDTVLLPRQSRRGWQSSATGSF